MHRLVLYMCTETAPPTVSKITRFSLEFNVRHVSSSSQGKSWRYAHTHTHTHTRWVSMFVFHVPHLPLNLPVAENFLHFYIFKKHHYVWCISCFPLWAQIISPKDEIFPNTILEVSTSSQHRDTWTTHTHSVLKFWTSNKLTLWNNLSNVVIFVNKKML